MSETQIVWCKTKGEAQRQWRNACIASMLPEFEREYPSVLEEHATYVKLWGEEYRGSRFTQAMPEGPIAFVLKLFTEEQFTARNQKMYKRGLPEPIDGVWLRHSNTMFVIGDGTPWAGMHAALVLPILFPGWEPFDYDHEEV